jgi:hypothetical protein
MAKPIVFVPDERLEWNETFSVADELLIEAMDDRTRTAVERYARTFGQPVARCIECRAPEADCICDDDDEWEDSR